MIKEEQKSYLLKRTEKLIKYLNTIIGSGKDKVMSQRELAEHLGCSNSTVSRWLSGEFYLSLDIAIKICDILKLDKKEFLDLTEKNKDENSKRYDSNTLIVDLNMSKRIKNALLNANILKVADLVEMNKTELYRNKGIGKKGLEEIEKKLQELGFSLTPTEQKEISLDTKLIDINFKEYGIDSSEEECIINELGNSATLLSLILYSKGELFKNTKLLNKVILMLHSLGFCNILEEEFHNMIKDNNKMKFNTNLNLNDSVEYLLKYEEIQAISGYIHSLKKFGVISINDLLKKDTLWISSEKLIYFMHSLGYLFGDEKYSTEVNELHNKVTKKVSNISNIEKNIISLKKTEDKKVEKKTSNNPEEVLEKEITKISKENTELEQRIAKKEELLKTYKDLIKAKENLIQRELDLDNEIAEALITLNNLNSHNRSR